MLFIKKICLNILLCSTYVFVGKKKQGLASFEALESCEMFGRVGASVEEQELSRQGQSR